MYVAVLVTIISVFFLAYKFAAALTTGGDLLGFRNDRALSYRIACILSSVDSFTDLFPVFHACPCRA